MSRSQDHTMAQLLMDLEMTSNGVIYSYSPISSKTGFTGGPPRTGDNDPPHVTYRVEYERARTDEDRDRVIGRATRALGQLVKSPAPPVLRPESVGDRDKRILQFGTGLSAHRVAIALRVQVVEVKRARRDAGQDPESGDRLPVSKEKLSRDERRRRVVELKRRQPNASARMIARQLGIDHHTVQQDLRDAA